MKAGRLMVIRAAALIVVAGATAAGAAVAAGPISSGVIHGCWTNKAVHGSHVIKLQNAGTRCPRGTTAISWNHKGPAGPTGATGATGPRGAAGAQGTAGPGFDFQTASGTDGPTLAAGTYFIVVKAAISDSNNVSVSPAAVWGLPPAGQARAARGCRGVLSLDTGDPPCQALDPAKPATGRFG
jgi:hypothetical protein